MGSEVKNQLRMNEKKASDADNYPTNMKMTQKPEGCWKNTKWGGHKRKRGEKILYGYKKTQTCYATQQSSGGDIVS